MAKVLELSGIAAADAVKQAADVVAFEKRLAKVSKSSEQMSRDVKIFYNPVSPADADKLAPNFPWTKFFESQGVATPKMFSLARATATRPSHLAAGLPAAAEAISAPTIMTDEIALVTAISGVCSAGVTDQTT